jgi:serine/threonine protein kinase
MAETMTGLIGQSLGRYHILEQLGEGGMATVYKAYDTRLERDVAVKVIRVDQFSPAALERVLQRFEREAKALAKLIHPNIVHVNDYGEQGGIPYLVMDYMPGGTLKNRLGRSIPWQEAARLLLPIARALQFAHAQGIIHRDVKPSNILITLSGEPMLSDFGIAKILETDEITSLTGTGTSMGTPEYMAPEQWIGEVGLQSDIYSLGVVFYEMVTSRKPYMADTPPAIMLKQATEPLPRPTRYVPSLPSIVEKMLLKALARNSENRFSTMAAFTEALENLLLDQNLQKQPSTSKTVLLEVATPADSKDTMLQEETCSTRMQETTFDRVPGSPPARNESLPGEKNISLPRTKHNSSWLYWLIGGVGVACLVLVGVMSGIILYPRLHQTQPTIFQIPEDQTSPLADISLTPERTHTRTETIGPSESLSPTMTTANIPQPQPRLFNFQSCPQACNGQNDQSVFPEKTTIIYLQWQYENIPANASYMRISSYGSLEWARYECIWPGQSSGTEYRTFTEPAGIRSGTWTLTVVINGITLLTENMIVEGTWDFWDPAGYFEACEGKR